MNHKIELLAPGGDVDAIKAAIIAGADAVYCGLDTFNARNRAANISFDELVGVIRLAHQYQCQIFLTLNIIILEREFTALAKLLSRLVNTTLDGVIVQDIGLFNLIKKHFPSLDLHASTQLTTHNAGQIPFLKKLGASRVNLSRELNLTEITAITAVAREHKILSEVFVHGSLCIAFSGLCYSTSASVGNSGNRGRCSQACREEYEPTQTGNKFPLNIKDNSAFFDLPALIEAGVHSFKIEGRIKGASYVHTVVDSFRKQIDGFMQTGQLLEDGERLYKVFNRDFSNAFLRGDLNQSMFIDNPRDNSKIHALAKNAVAPKDAVEKSDVAKNNIISVVQIHEVEESLYAEKSQINATVQDKIKYLSIDKVPLTLAFSGQPGSQLTVTVTTQDVAVGEQTPAELAFIEKQEFTVQSTSLLVNKEQGDNLKTALEKRFKSLNNAEFTLKEMDMDGLGFGLSLPFKELTVLKNEVARLLNNARAVLPPVELPPLVKHPKPADSQPESLGGLDTDPRAVPRTKSGSKLSILISDPADLGLLDVTNADIYFKLPDAYKRDCTKYIDLLNKNPGVIPWFPAVLIGKDYDVAINILHHVMPPLIVTNNTGIAYKAYELGIKWIAGPFLNITNSYALMAFKEEFDCSGAFISNEINKQQMQNIARPENFKLFYSIYHPILLMTSRQCFFQQSVGCDKPRIDNGCMLSCDKSTTITNLKGVSFEIDKQKAGYPSIYNHDQFLNMEIVNDLGHLFDGFLIDLTNIGAGDKELPDKAVLISQFEQLLAGNSTVATTLNAMVPASTVSQYHTGL
ncbi:MAG: putative protease [Paraglaciecola sp.]|jgi:putative protease